MTGRLKLVTVEEMKAIEQKANSNGLTYDRMMEFAGKGIADVVNHRFGNLEEKRILGLVGSGNNGGDTLVALELLVRSGGIVPAYLLRPRSEADCGLE